MAVQTAIAEGASLSMDKAAEPAEGNLDADVARLHQLGYAQELRRRMGGFSNFAVSFSIISLLSGCLTAYYFGMLEGGPIEDSYERAWKGGYRDLTPANLYEHSLFKMGAKEISSQEGASLTFMAKYDAREGNSCHIHMSLRDESDQPVFSGDGHHGFSKVFDQFIAGLLATLRELTLFVAPNINSYKRFVPGSFAPTALAWGHDNRSCAFASSGIIREHFGSSAGYRVGT